MLKKLKFLLLPLLSLHVFLHATEIYEDKKVEKIDICIEKADPDVTYSIDTILKRMQTHEGDRFSQITFDTDLKMLSEEYDRIEPSVSLEHDKIHITIKVWPRPMIHTVDWSGNKKFSKKKLQKELGVRPGNVFNRVEFNKQFNKVKEFYVKKGYFESQLSYTIVPIQGTNQVNIDIDVREGKTGHIKKLILTGFTRSERSDLLAQMYTKQYNFFYSWLIGTGTFRDDAIEQDKMTILNYLHNKGYADARVDIGVENNETADKIIVTINAHRGPVYHFGTITYDGNSLISDKDILKRFLVHSGDVYSPEKLRDTVQAIRDLYGQKGHIEAEVVYEIKLSENEPVFDIDFYIREGDPFKIGMIHILGNQSTNSNVILRESLLVPGERFDSRRLKATQMRLENIGYFKNVNVYAVRSADEKTLGDNYRDVYIEVEETTTGSLSLFMGFSSMDDVFGGLEVTERNFNILGIGDLISKGTPKSLRGGGEYFHVRASVGAKQTNYLISWMDPYVRDSLWRLGFEIVRTTSNLQSKDYDVDTVGFSVYASYPLSNYWTFGTKYRLRYSDTDVENKAKLAQLKDEIDHAGILSSVGTSLTYDSTDSAYKPHRGLRSGAEVEVAGIAGKFRFLKTGFINTLYVPLWKKGITKYRGDVRFILPFGELNERVPVSEKFFLGGETTVRGYAPFHIGPLVDGEPIGGITSALVSFEYNQEIFRMLDVFVFVDAGSVSQKEFQITKLRASVGGGIRLELMNRTPIMLGYGYPINPKHGKEDEKRFFFSLAGQF